MKIQLSKKTFWKSTFSLAVLFLFIYFGFGSTSLFGLLGVPINTTSTFNDETQEYTQQIYGIKGENIDTTWTQFVTTKKDYYGNWRRESTITNVNYKYNKEEAKYYQSQREETVNFTNGKRDGMSITVYRSFVQYDGDDNYYNQKYSVDTVCYDYGNIIPCNQLKNAVLNNTEISAFEILDNNYPWYLGTLNVLGFSNEYVQSYLDTLEVILNAESFEFSKFENQYDDAIDLLEEIPFDSLVQINEMVTSVYGLELMKDLEFRMAVIDQQRYKNSSTFQLLKTSYPHFLTSFDADTTIVEDSEWENFCSKFDSLMNIFSPLDVNDPFFVDTVDTRIFNTLIFIYQEEPGTTKSALITSALKQASLNKKNFCLPCLLKEHTTPNSIQQTLEVTPNVLAGSIISRLLRKYLYEGDIPRLAVKEAFSTQNNIATLASITTQLNGEIAENEFEFQGNVIKDGGAEITERGLVWAKFNNPTVDDNRIIAGEGIGKFTSSLQITDDNTYYVRAFATNSAGTAYGNRFILNSSGLVGINELKSNNLKFKIYPNPASEEISLEFHLNKSQEIAIKLIDLNGKIVFLKQLPDTQIGKNNIRIDISGVSNGVYVAKLAGNGNFQYSRKLQISH